MADQAVCPKDSDSALAVTASIAGILTLCFAISATTWFHVNSVRKADSEFLGLKTALDWYKKESEWINDLVVQQADYHQVHHKHRPHAPQHRPATSSTNGHPTGEVTHNGALVHEPDSCMEACAEEVQETVRAAEEAIEVHEAHIGRRSRTNSQPLSSHDPKAKARKNWRTAKRRIYRKNRFTRAAHEEVLLRHKILKERKMHTILLEELARTDRDLNFIVISIVDTINPPPGWDADTNPTFKQPADVETMTMKSGKSGRSRVRDEETGISHTGSFRRTKAVTRRFRAWLQASMGWHRLSKLFVQLLPVSNKYRRKMKIAMEWLPKRGKALELQRQREALGNRIVFATLAMIGSRLSDQELRGSMHELLVKELVDTTRAVDAEEEQGDGGAAARMMSLRPVGRRAGTVS